MAIQYREDSIKELNEQKEQKEAVVNELGEQLAMTRIENMQIKADSMQKEIIIDSLGSEQAITKIELLQIKADISALKGGE